jgi:hypothetical protein
MARTAFTLRIETAERNALKSLSKVEGRPINQLLNEAIKAYLGQKGRKERALHDDMKRLEAYRKKDPKFRRAIAKFVEAEATTPDPLEGEPFEETEEALTSSRTSTGTSARKSTGPVQSKVREVLGA